MTHKYKGKEYEIQVGSRGGWYIISDEGKKIAVKKPSGSSKKKSSTPLQRIKQEEKPKLKTYICYYEKRNEDGELVDDFKEWTKAYSYDEALNHFKDEYRHNDKIEISLITRE